MTEKIQKRTDDWGDTEYYKEITLKLRFISSNDGIVDEVNKNSIMEVLNDKSFDGLGYWEEIE